MLVNSEETLVLSPFAYTERGTLQVFEPKSDRVSRIVLSDAKYLSLIPGSDDFYSIVHHFDNGQCAVTAHNFSDPGKAISQITVKADGLVVSGDQNVWNHLRSSYIARFRDSVANTAEYGLVWKDSNSSEFEVQSFDWFADSYDDVYQSVIDVAEAPDQGLLIISVQRSSTLVIYDPSARQRVGEIKLVDGQGNPSLYFRKNVPELWASDYDTLVKLDAQTWETIVARKFEEPRGGMARLFIGSYWFPPDERVCILARPYSGDIVSVDPGTMEIRQRCVVGEMPFSAVILSDGMVVSCDGKTGELLRGTMQDV